MALFTQTSIGPNASSSGAALHRPLLGRRRRPELHDASAAGEDDIALRAPRPSRPRASRPRRAPSRANRCATARPTPADAPVTATTWRGFPSARVGASSRSGRRSAVMGLSSRHRAAQVAAPARRSLSLQTTEARTPRPSPRRADRGSGGNCERDRGDRYARGTHSGRRRPLARPGVSAACLPPLATRPAAAARATHSGRRRPLARPGYRRRVCRRLRRGRRRPRAPPTAGGGGRWRDRGIGGVSAAACDAAGGGRARHPQRAAAAAGATGGIGGVSAAACDGRSGD